MTSTRNYHIVPLVRPDHREPQRVLLIFRIGAYHRNYGLAVKEIGEKFQGFDLGIIPIG
jgi:hypothetical protein